MFSIACTVTKRTVTSSSSSVQSSPTSDSSPFSGVHDQSKKPVTIETSSMTTTTTSIPSHRSGPMGAASDSSNGPQPFRRRSTFRKIFMSIGIILLAGGASIASALVTPYRSLRHNDHRPNFPPVSRQPCLDEVASRERHAAWLDREYGHSPSHRAHHLPQCSTNGLYNATQCRSELDLCWCVAIRSGRVLSKVFHPGRAGEIRCTDEATDDEEEENDAPNMSSGNNNTVNYDGKNSTLTGNGTDTNNSTQNSTPEPPQKRRRPSLRDGPCVWARRELAARRREKGGRLLGAYEPQCTDDGMFERTQCHASSGFCWCVDEHTGERISQAFRSWVRGIDCDAEEFLINASFRA